MSQYIDELTTNILIDKKRERIEILERRIRREARRAERKGHTECANRILAILDRTPGRL